MGEDGRVSEGDAVRKLWAEPAGDEDLAVPLVGALLCDVLIGESERPEPLAAFTGGEEDRAVVA